MAPSTLKLASLFSGCGGFDAGFEANGFKPIAAYDFDRDAVANYQTNLPGPIYRVDLKFGIPNSQLLSGIDALIAGPPCQGFSTMGKRLLDDERNHLLTLTGVLAKRVNPKVLVVENVAGALSGEHSRYLSELNFMMRSSGYRTHTIRCQAGELGLPQLRKRILFFAWRTGKEIRFIKPSFLPGDLRGALDGVIGKPNHHPKSLKRGSVEWTIATRIRPGQKLSNVRGGGNAVATWDIPEVFGNVTEEERTVLELLRRLRRQDRQREYGDADPVSFARLEKALGSPFHRLVEALISKGYVRRVGGAVDLVGTFNGKFRRLVWELPSCTVDTRFGCPRYFLHPSQQRGFTVREAARIQGFNDSFIFHGDNASQFRLIGNAVPPPLGQLAAKFTKQLLGIVP